MNTDIWTIQPDDFPTRLQEIEDPPDKLYARGEPLPDTEKYLCVVGSRKYTQYGKDMCEKIIGGLAGAGITIVSGLALGMDAIAHKAALETGLDCVAIPGSGLNKEVLYPRTNLPLAKRILEDGGTLLSEFEPSREAASWTFPQRNRIMAGLAHATLVVEATEQSGTLITARLTGEFNRDIFTVPGSLKSKNTAGPHALIRDGAALIRDGSDILKELGLEKLSEDSDGQATTEHLDLSAKQQEIINELSEPKSKDDLIAAVDLPPAKVNTLLSQLEIKGVIKESNGKIERA
jgi:DNA processing protein